MKDGYRYERAFVDVVEQMLSDRGIDRTEFSRAVFQHQLKKPDNKWQCLLRPVSKTGKPQRLTLEDAYNIARFLGYDFPDLVEKVRRYLRDMPESKGFGAALAS